MGIADQMQERLDEKTCRRRDQPAQPGKDYCPACEERAKNAPKLSDPGATDCTPHAVRTSVTLEHALEVLNRLAQADPVATLELVQARVGCNEKVAEDPTIQVHTNALALAADGVLQSHEVYAVGLLGVLNGMFGVIQEGVGAGCGPITCAYMRKGEMIGHDADGHPILASETRVEFLPTAEARKKQDETKK